MIDKEYNDELQKEYDEELENRLIDFSDNPLTKYTEEELKSFVDEYSFLYKKHKNDKKILITNNEFWSLIHLFNKLVNAEGNIRYIFFEDWKSNFHNLNKLLFNTIYKYKRGYEICEFDRATSLEDIVKTPIFKNIDPRIVKYLIRFMNDVDEAKRGS